MYGFESKEVAETKAKELRASTSFGGQQSSTRFVVMPHSYSVSGVPLTYGVGRYVPYCEKMPERFDGFVWFPMIKHCASCKLDSTGRYTSGCPGCLKMAQEFSRKERQGDMATKKRRGTRQGSAAILVQKSAAGRRCMFADTWSTKPRRKR